MVFGSSLPETGPLYFLPISMKMNLGKENEQLIAAIDRIKPDGILSGGDLIVTKKGQARTRVSEVLLAALASRYPIYCGNGNHESRMRC